MSCLCVSTPQAITLAFAYRQVYTAVLLGRAPATRIYLEEKATKFIAIGLLLLN